MTQQTSTNQVKALQATSAASASPNFSTPSSVPSTASDPTAGWTTLILWGSVILAVLLISPLRTFLGRLIGSLIQWILAEASLMTARSLLYLLKSIVAAHWILLRNLVSPRSVMARPKVGEVVRIVPNHVCVVVNMVDRMIAVRGDRIVEVLPVAARGRLT